MQQIKFLYMFMCSDEAKKLITKKSTYSCSLSRFWWNAHKIIAARITTFIPIHIHIDVLKFSSTRTRIHSQLMPWRRGAFPSNHIHFNKTLIKFKHKVNEPRWSVTGSQSDNGVSRHTHSHPQTHTHQHSTRHSLSVWRVLKYAFGASICVSAHST